jgi:hypothetical protein
MNGKITTTTTEDHRVELAYNIIMNYPGKDAIDAGEAALITLGVDPAIVNAARVKVNTRLHVMFGHMMDRLDS